MFLYEAVENDRYELPLAVAGSIEELAAMVHLAKSTVESCISREATGNGKQREKGEGRVKYIRVDVGERKKNARIAPAVKREAEKADDMWKLPPEKPKKAQPKREWPAGAPVPVCKTRGFRLEDYIVKV